jgi:hypothetical protein
MALVDPVAAGAPTPPLWETSDLQFHNTLRLVIVSAQLHPHAPNLTFAGCLPDSPLALLQTARD